MNDVKRPTFNVHKKLTHCPRPGYGTQKALLLWQNVVAKAL